MKHCCFFSQSINTWCLSRKMWNKSWIQNRYDIFQVFAIETFTYMPKIYIWIMQYNCTYKSTKPTYWTQRAKLQEYSYCAPLPLKVMKRTKRTIPSRNHKTLSHMLLPKFLWQTLDFRVLDINKNKCSAFYFLFFGGWGGESVFWFSVLFVLINKWWMQVRESFRIPGNQILVNINTQLLRIFQTKLIFCQTRHVWSYLNSRGEINSSMSDEKWEYVKIDGKNLHETPLSNSQHM